MIVVIPFNTVSKLLHRDACIKRQKCNDTKPWERKRFSLASFQNTRKAFGTFPTHNSARRCTQLRSPFIVCMVFFLKMQVLSLKLFRWKNKQRKKTTRTLCCFNKHKTLKLAVLFFNTCFYIKIACCCSSQRIAKSQVRLKWGGGGIHVLKFFTPLFLDKEYINSIRWWFIINTTLVNVPEKFVQKYFRGLKERTVLFLRMEGGWMVGLMQPRWPNGYRICFESRKAWRF